MGRPSSGIAKAALVTGIIGAANAMNNNNRCNSGILSNIFGNNNNCNVTKEEFAFGLQNQEKMAAKDARIAQLEANTSTDAKILELYEATNAQFEKRDTVTNGALIELGKESVRNEYARADIAELKETVKAHGFKISELSSGVSVLSERVNGVAISLTQKIEAQGKELAASIGLVQERSECADKNIYAYINGHYVQGELVMPLDKICPQAAPLCEESGAIRVKTVK